MCITKVLQPNDQEIAVMERRATKKAMPYAQIQFTSDCIRKYALSQGIPMYQAMKTMTDTNGFEILNKLYKTKPQPSIAQATQILKKSLTRNETLSRD